MLNNFIQLCTESFLQDSEPSHRMGSFVAILALAGAWLDLESSVCCMRLTVLQHGRRGAQGVHVHARPAQELQRHAASGAGGG